MMEGIRDYLVCVIGACMLAVPGTVMVKKPSIRRVLRLMGGVLILLVAIRPLLRLDMGEISRAAEELLSSYRLDTSFLEERSGKMEEYVRKATEDYIEMQAAEAGALLQAQVELSGGEWPVPVFVRLIGSADAEQAAQLSKMLERDLALTPEQQEWRLYGADEAS